MIRDLILIVLMFVGTAVGIVCFVTGDRKNKARRSAILSALCLTAALEAAYCVMFILNHRLIGVWFFLFAFVCCASNALTIAASGGKGAKIAAALVAAACGAFIIIQAVFVTSENVVVDGVMYVGEYESVTGVSQTVVKCYKKRNAFFSESKESLLLDYGIILTGKPDLTKDPYEIISVDGGVD